MCGIFGCIGKGNLIKATLDGLRILQYRGYDSAGIAYWGKKQLKVIKSVGDIEQLAKKITTTTDTPNLCIGHTRWATNGAVNEQNAHPHLSNNGQIAVVHNGIIENYQQCQQLLSKKNITLQTTVDTEAIPNILYILQHNKHDIYKYLQGQYVFCALDIAAPNALFIAKNGNLPLYIGKSKQATYITSDTLALPATVTAIISLDDGDTAEVRPHQTTFFHHGQPITKAWQPFAQTFTASVHQGFATFMEKEIHEIPQICQSIIQSYQQDANLSIKLTTVREIFNQADCIHWCGCGTSYHAALILARLTEQYLKIRSLAHISSEFTTSRILSPREISVIISQSGETADSIICQNLLQEQNIPVITFCNVTSSTIAQRAQINLPLLCGPEIAVASTKVFFASLLLGCLIFNQAQLTDFNQLPKLAQQALTQAQQLLPLKPHQTPEFNKIFFIGKGLDYFLALEAALKVKEVTYTHCEGYPANELKHGPLSLVDNKTLAIVYTSDTTANAIAEITARGGQIWQIPDPAPHNPLSFLVKIIPAQLFALHLAENLGINPDRPRNLAKSVTVL